MVILVSLLVNDLRLIWKKNLQLADNNFLCRGWKKQKNGEMIKSGKLAYPKIKKLAM